MYKPSLIDKKVKFKFTHKKLIDFYGNEWFDGIIVKKGCKNYIESSVNATPEDISRYGLDYFNLDEAEVIWEFIK